jgi:alkylation response protein AidB-like acyl-CoA dehydrogenase
MSVNNAEKDKAMELAEESREAEWKFPSFTAELFRGNFHWELMNPYPVQDPEDKKIGDDYIAKIKEVAEKYVDPVAIDRTGEYPMEALKKFAEIGAFGMKISKKYGGLGLSQTNYARVLHWLGSYCQSTVTWLSAHQSIGVPQPLKLFGTEEQKQKFLPRLAAGEISAFALTEPNVGSDPAKMELTATPSEDGSYYLLNGVKLWCTNGPDADILIVMAKTPSKSADGKERTQITAFITEKTMPGYEVTHRCKFMGLKGLSNGLLSFNNVKVPKENIIGKPGDGLKIALTTLNAGRLGIPAASTGAGKYVLKEIKKWANERVQWGVPIGKHQAIAKMISNMSADIFAMDSIVWLCCSMVDRGNADIRLEAAIAKYFCTETSWRLIDDAIQVRGGRGYETETSLHSRGDEPMVFERFLRDSRIGRIFEGSSQVMHLIMAREAVDTHFKLVMPLMKPKKGQKVNKMSVMAQAAKFYAGWYPKLWLPASIDFNTKNLNAESMDNLGFIASAAKKMARTIFHTMGKFREKLEFEQILLGDFVEIGVDLFSMSAVLAHAEQLIGQNPSDTSPQELANLFCKNARKRIAEHFRAVKKNHNKKYREVGDGLLDGKYDWLMTGMYDNYAPSMRDWASHGTEASHTGSHERVEAVK